MVSIALLTLLFRYGKIEVSPARAQSCWGNFNSTTGLIIVNDNRSFSWVYHVIKSQLPPKTKYVLLTIKTYVPDSGTGNLPSVDYLTLDTGLARDDVVEAIKIAYASGFLFDDNGIISLIVP